MMRITDLFDAHNVPYKTHGHEHCRPGWSCLDVRPQPIVQKNSSNTVKLDTMLCSKHPTVRPHGHGVFIQFPALTKFPHLILRENGATASRPSTFSTVPILILGVVLPGIPAEVTQPVVVPNAVPVTAFHTFRAGTDERLKDETVRHNQPVNPSVVEGNPSITTDPSRFELFPPHFTLGAGFTPKTVRPNGTVTTNAVFGETEKIEGAVLNF